ncbi:MAG: hypothetical protein ACRD1Z_07725, partial [Vicinamibacteria bacterium]
SLDRFHLVGWDGDGGDMIFDIGLDGYSIAGDGVFVLATAPPAGVDPVAGADLFASFALQNGPDGVELLFGDEVIDSLAYGDFGLLYPGFGEGTPAVDAPPGSSLERIFGQGDRNDNFLDFAANAHPTPGVSAAPLSAPEPAPPILLGIGVAALAVARRFVAGREVERR